jgi:hypothetical protein
MVLLRVEPDWADVLSPVVLALSAASHEKVDAGPAVNPKFSAVPLQTVVLVALVIIGLGFTVTVTTCGLPTHDPVVVVGVTV